ncbi:hypothetical protein [Clostridium estertheticum]|uniref:hypothetical protein n=1 Tax=Clostridium estertheticum TaxID=238834 RepID=UPI000AFB9017|nr:hypothetical protein [Clostridium estertheticum]MBU3072444.1 hypothetical protein [Clostridium estertheticum]MBU3162537.1 hypothetical protein [Clostridium estertheticum]MBU3170260.1 hypothetical protein [Clostridium estertheticum]MBU3186190.1 hypothetical protein [Clostridium estertheticum]MBZ9618176.1 hypothetical protein [Clostridium estertheticum subsp. laramiense]
MVKDIINYLNSNKIQGNAYDEKVTDKGGSVISIQSAVRDKVTKFPDGSTDRVKLYIL